MKKNLIKAGLFALALTAAPVSINAQLSNILSKVNQINSQVNQTRNTANSAVNTGTSTAAQIQNILGKLKSNKNAGIATDMIAKILGDADIKESSLVGTWSYNQPCVAFTSEDKLADLGGTVISSKLEDKLGSALSKAGISSNKVIVTFNEDNTFNMNIANKKQVSGTYSVDGCNVTLNFKSPKKTVVCNGKLTLGTLQLAMEANGLFDVVSAAAMKASAFSTEMSALSSLISNYDGMYLGLELIKQ